MAKKTKKATDNSLKVIEVRNEFREKEIRYVATIADQLETIKELHEANAAAQAALKEMSKRRDNALELGAALCDELARFRGMGEVLRAMNHTIDLCEKHDIDMVEAARFAHGVAKPEEHAPCCDCTCCDDAA